MNDPGTQRQWGTGPGPIAADGSPVLLYTALGPADEPAVIGAAVPPGATILELGCGAGRVTKALAAGGHPVVAIDADRAMLAAMGAGGDPAINVVHARIEHVRLNRRFDAVLLASQLVNTVDASSRAAMLATCRRHVLPDGVVVIQRHDPSFLTGPIDRSSAGRRFVVRDTRSHGDGVVSGVLEYHIDGETWVQSIWVQNLSDDEIAGALEAASLRLDGFLTDDRTWLRAVPV